LEDSLIASEVIVNKKPHRVKVLETNEDGFLVEVNEKKVKVKVKNTGQNGIAAIEVNGKSFQTSVERTQTGSFQVKIGGKIFAVEIPPKIQREKVVEFNSVTASAKKTTLALPKEKGLIVAPIAGRIVSLKAGVGQRIEKGDCVCVLEAMKMQNEVNATEAGILREIRVSEGAIVNKGDVLAVIG
jgi:biotin carboxyl carrier protein